MSLLKERKAAGLTQMELARLAGVPQGSISQMENGRLLRPSFQTLLKLAGALRECGRNVTAAQLQPHRQPTLVKGARKNRATA